MYKNEAFKLGEDFHRVGHDIIPENWLDSDDFYWFVPSIVNMAFACELYLKSLVLDGSSAMKEHDWVKFYNLLTPSQQMKIHHFMGNDDLLENIREGGRVFVDWRYIFEHDRPKSVDIIFLENFAIVLHELAQENLD